MNKNNSRRKRFVWLTYPESQFVWEVKARTPGRNPKAGTEAEAIDECRFLSCSPWGAQLAFLYNPRSPTWGGSAHSGLGLPVSIIKHEKAPQTCPQV